MKTIIQQHSNSCTPWHSVETCVRCLLHNEELNDLYSSPNIVWAIKSRRMRWAEHVARMGEERGAYGVLVGNTEGRRPLGRPRRRWVDNIRMDLQEVGCVYMDWIALAQDRDMWRTLVSAVMNLGVPWNVGNFLTSCKPVSFSRRTLHHGVSKKVSSFSKYQTLLRYTHKYVICLRKIVWLSLLWKMSTALRCKWFCRALQPNRTRNVEIMDRNSLTDLLAYLLRLYT